jgi:putative acetyltransferase
VSDAAIVVRRGGPGDAEPIFRLSLEAIRTSAAAHYTPAQLGAWASRRTLAAHQRMIEETVLFVAVVDGRVAGFSNLVVAESLLDHLFVAPSAGGRGVARALVTRVSEAAVDAGLDEVHTHASWRAAPVFERLGYERLEVEVVDIDGEQLSRVHMRRQFQRR